mgnify:FL=1
MSESKKTEIIEAFIKTGKISDQVLNLYDERQLLKVLSDLNKRIDSLYEVQRLNGFVGLEIDELNERAFRIETYINNKYHRDLPFPSFEERMRIEKQFWDEKEINDVYLNQFSKDVLLAIYSDLGQEEEDFYDMRNNIKFNKKEMKKAYEMHNGLKILSEYMFRVYGEQLTVYDWYKKRE